MFQLIKIEKTSFKFYSPVTSNRLNLIWFLLEYAVILPRILRRKFFLVKYNCLIICVNRYKIPERKDNML